MIRTRSTMHEVDLAEKFGELLAAQGVEYVTERPVLLPTGEYAIPDMIARRVDSTREIWIVIECKRRLDANIEQQCLRWVGLANIIVAVVELTRGSEQTRARASRMRYKGGIIVSAMSVIAPGKLAIAGESYGDCNLNADTRLIEAAFRAGVPDLDAPAGSQSARRQNAARAAWQDDTRALREYGPMDNRALNRTLRKHVTAAARRRAVDEGTWLGVSYTDDLPTMFYAKEGA